MSKEQIEEMAKDLIESHSIDAWAARVHGEAYTDFHASAEKMFDRGWIKQSEGEWIWINQAKGYLEPPYGDTCKCSLCEFVIDISESNYNFCPNCGAKMKGGGE
jgi:hypothetical protein